MPLAGSNFNAQGVLIPAVQTILQNAANALASLTGAITTDDVLREIFAKFCIGK